MGATGFSRVYKTGVSGDGSKFDVARNWAFVEALLSDPHVHVTNLFVASHLKRRLLEEAARAGASERASEQEGICM